MDEHYEEPHRGLPPDPNAQDAAVNAPFSLPEEEHLDRLPAPGGAVQGAMEAEAVSDAAQADVGSGLVGDYDDYGYEPPVRTRRRAPAEQNYPQEPPDRDYGCADVITAIFLLMSVAICAFTALLL